MKKERIYEMSLDGTSMKECAIEVAEIEKAKSRLNHDT